MSLTTDLNLPLPKDFKSKDKDDYLNELVKSLQSMYEKVAQNVNGTLRNSALTDSSEWIPTLVGGTTAGTTTYVRQTGWVLRSGILTDVWFDIEWSATTATGTLYLVLPYSVTKSPDEPFIGPVRTSGITYGTGFTSMVCSALQTTTNLGFGISSSTGVATKLLTVSAVGRISGNCRYIGVADE